MAKVGRAVLTLIAAAIIAPPLWYTILPEEPRTLPDPGSMVRIDPGFRLNVLDRGAGPVIVLVHGLPGSAYDWRSLTPQLNAQGYRTIAYDRAGYGHSDARSAAEPSLRVNVAELVALLEALDLRDVTLIGWSYGGAMAMSAAANARIARLVLIGTGGPSSADQPPPKTPLSTKILYFKPLLAWRAAVPPVSRALQAVLSDVAFGGAEQPDWWRIDLAANFTRPETLATYREEVLAEIDPQGIDPAAISRPTLIIHGEQDQLAPVAIGRYLATQIPTVSYLEIPAGSHMLPITHPELLANEIAGFAHSLGAASSTQPAD